MNAMLRRPTVGKQKAGWLNEKAVTMKKYIIILAVVFLTTSLFIPFQTTLVPKWRLQVIDENGVPYKRQLVRQSCHDYTLGVSPCAYREDADQYSDQYGFVEFPERTISASLIGRLLSTLKNYALVFAHGSIGEDVHVDSSGPEGYQVLRYDPATGMPPEEFVLPSRPLR